MGSGCSAEASFAQRVLWLQCRGHSGLRSNLGDSELGPPEVLTLSSMRQVVKKGSVEKGCSWSLRFFRDVISTLFSGLGSQWSTRIEDLGQELVDIVAKVVGASGADWLEQVVADLL